MSTHPNGQPQPRHYSWLAHQPIQRKIWLAIGLLLALFLAASGVIMVALQEQTYNREWSIHTYDVLLRLDEVEHALLASQAGARGYLLTQDAGELDAFRANHRNLDRHIGLLRNLTRDNPVQQARIDRLQVDCAQWFTDVNRLAVAPLAATWGTLAPEDAQRIQRAYMSGRSIRVTDINLLIDQMSDTERQLLTQRNGRLDRTLARARAITAFSILLSVLLGGWVIWLTSRLITRPLQRMTGLMTRLANHDHALEIRHVERRDEIGEIARALQVFRQMAIDITAQTARKSQLSSLSQSLQQAEAHHAFGARLTRELAPLLHAGVALFYRYEASDERLERIGSYGLRDEDAPIESTGDAALVAQAAREKHPIALDQLPDGFVRIGTGSGSATPHHVLLLPALSHGQTVGVLELAMFAAPDAQQQQLLEELLPLIALTLENLNRASHTRQLLARSEEQADRLRASEEAMRDQQDALRQSNEALRGKTVELQEQSQRLIVSEEELRVQTEELQASNEELREKTERLNSQRARLELLQRDTEHKAEELARASQYKSDFLANMSHELRTPLNSLLILSRSLSDNDTGNLDEEQVESARIIHDSGSSLLRLINDILDLSKIEAGKMELMIDELPLAQLAQRLRRTFTHVAQGKQLRFEVIIDPALPARPATDGPRLEQVVNNLLSNAFKFTAQGGVTLTVGRPTASMPLPAALKDQALVAISVKDSGIGIPPDKFHRVFAAFEQVDASTSRHYGGTGLGLAISRRIANLLGGDIVLESAPGEGSTFTVLLPERSSAPASEEKSSTPTPAARPPAAPSSSALIPEAVDDDRAAIAEGDTVILAVEDDVSFARILVEMIRRKGHRALAATDGETGLTLAKQFHPTGILLDVMLPGMDGWTVIERLKGDPATRQIPVHFLSATDEAARGRELGAVGFLTKPVSREAITGAFERLLHFAEGQTRRLLIVDDDADSRAAVRRMLRNDTVDIDEASSAEEALEKTRDTTFDCIVLDLGLPGMSGMELLEQLSQSESGVPPVVIYSGRDLSREESLQLRQYTDSIVVKGARSPERLLDEVSLFLHSIQHGGRGAAPADARTGQELTGRKVLLVDDDMRNLFALSKVLRGWGVVVTMAQDGHKALAALEQDNGVELVLMDIMMPGMDGYATTRAIRAIPSHARLPIIALTAKAMRGDREKCLEAGASDYLSKPIDIDRLGSMIRVWLQR